jgi:hypothetical protein
VYSGYNIFGVNFFQALTTFRDLTAQEFDFLPYLEQLEDLELGDCSEWETEVCMKYEPSIDHLRNRLNFDLNKSRQKLHHSLKEHHKISNIPKFRCEML